MLLRLICNLRAAARRCEGQYMTPVNPGDLSLSKLMLMAADLLERKCEETPMLHVEEAEDLLEALLTAADEARRYGYSNRRNYLRFREAYQRALDAMGIYE